MPLACAAAGADDGASGAVCGGCCGGGTCRGAAGLRSSPRTGPAATGALVGVVRGPGNEAGVGVAPRPGQGGRGGACTLVCPGPAAAAPLQDAPPPTSAPT